MFSISNLQTSTPYGIFEHLLKTAREHIFHRKIMENLLSRITLNPNICHGKPTVRNMRYPVEMILDLLSTGMTTQEILADYPALETKIYKRV